MSSQDNIPTPEFRPEAQSDRWIKYGSNVALSIILVVAIAVGLTWISQSYSKRWDWTIGGSLSLKPQTDAVVKDLKQPITLVSLYVRPDDKPDEVEQAQRVSDLLDEYKAKNSNIDVKVIDPARQKDKLEELHQEFIERYGKSIKNYKDYLDKWSKDYAQIKKLTDAEKDAVAPFVKPDLGDQEESRESVIVSTLSDALPQKMDEMNKAIQHELKQKHPDYKAASEAAKGLMQLLSQLSGQLIQEAGRAQLDKSIPEDFKKYLIGSVPHFQEIQAISDASVAAQGKLGELKIDQLEQALQIEDPILVLGKDEWRIISKSQVWQDDTDVRGASSSGKTKPRFAGEQQVTTAIYGLENPVKRKVCFVRAGGRPLTQQGIFRFMPGGPLSTIAQRLREYNFDVTEKDLSGQWAMQSQMQQMPTPPEPSDDQIKDALWVVIDVPTEQGMQGMPPPQIGPRLKAHLDGGGSALVLVQSHGEEFADSLKAWGIDIHSEALAVHETVKIADSAEADPIEQAKGEPVVWTIRDYGDSPIGASVKNLTSILYMPIVVGTHSEHGVTTMPLAPLTMSGFKSGTKDTESLEKGTPKFNPDKGDISPPIFAGAAAEKSGGGRVVVMSSVSSFTNTFMPLYDPKLAHKDPPLYVDLCPGNGALFQNSVFWLSHMEPMMAISATSMDVSRIGDMSDRVRDFWRVGVLMIILPGLVLAAGAFVYFSRRD